MRFGHRVQSISRTTKISVLAVSIGALVGFIAGIIIGLVL